MLISESQIGMLPAWQQAQLADPGWGSITPPAGAATLAAPEPEQALKQAGQPGHEEALSGKRGAARRASWLGSCTFPVGPFGKGEYENVPPDGVPSYDCNSDPGNVESGHAVEDLISTYENPARPRYAIDYVLQGYSLRNHFNASGGTKNSAQSAVYQLFATSRATDPSDPAQLLDYAELCYRADLAPGVGPGGSCGGVQPCLVPVRYEDCFNRRLCAGIDQLDVEVYDILIAPAGELSSYKVSDRGTTGRLQQFYCGTLPGCFGSGMLVGVESSASECQLFNEAVAAAGDSSFFINPLIGVLLLRWQQSAAPGSGEPWNGALGWPVLGPVVHHDFDPILTQRGSYRALGMWFEYGFIWWIDYDQELYPDAADEAQVYVSGSHVYSEDSDRRMLKLGTALRYSDRGPLGVSVAAERTLNANGVRYEVRAGEELLLHAHGYGGDPDAEWRYKYYVWRFDDGLLQTDGTAFVDDTQYVRHAFGEPGTYTVQVQVTDEADGTAYGQTLPIVVTE